MNSRVEADESQPLSESFAYFMIRLQRPVNPDLPAPLCGVIERLGTGEKLRFDDATALVQLLDVWRSLDPAPAKAGDAR